MSDKDSITPSGIVTIILILLAFASAVAQLNHSTSGHIFVFLAVFFSLAAIAVWAGQFLSSSSDAHKEDSSKKIPTAPHAFTEKPKPISSPLKSTDTRRQDSPQSDSQPDWTQYKEDYIQEILWQWYYKPHTGTRPLGLTPYCYECKLPTELQHCIGPYGMEDNITWLFCPTHYRQRHIVGDYHRQYASIEDVIQANIASGAWKEIVARQANSNRLW